MMGRWVNGLVEQVVDGGIGTNRIVDVDSLRMHIMGGFTKILKSDDGFFIAGYANVALEDDYGSEIGDVDNDAFDLDALDEAFTRMMSIESRRNLNATHTNRQIGEILWEKTDSHGITWKSGVKRVTTLQYPRRGLFIVAKLFDDINESKRYMSLMRRDKMLAFSIGGEAIKTKMVCEGDICRNRIVTMDLHEVSSCMKGRNKDSLAFVIKGTKSHPILKRAKDGVSLLEILRE